MKDASQVAAKWQRNLAGSTESIKQGVDAVTSSPTAAAAGSVAKWQASMQAQKTRDKYVAGLNRVTLQDWQTAMKEKGIARISAGASAAQPKFQKFMTELLPFVDTVRSKVHAMPKLTLEDSIARATTNMREMAKFKRSA